MHPQKTQKNAMAAIDLIKKQFSAVLAGLAVGVILGLTGLFWLDSRGLLLAGVAVLAITIVAGEKLIRCPVCGQSVYADIAREAAFTPSGVPHSCPKCQAPWSRPPADVPQPPTSSDEETP